MLRASRRAAPIVTTAAALLAATAAQTAAAQPAGRADVQALTRAYNASGQALFREFAARPGNIVFSPYSIGTAMAMVLAGARGDTEREMIAVLHHSLARGQIDDANASAIATLNGYDKGDVAPTCPSGMALSGERCEAKPTNGDPAFRAPDRAMQSVVTCRIGARTLTAPLELRWTLTYD